jgi:urea transporter
MSPLRSPWLIAAFLLAFLVVGLPYWRVPYAQVSLPTTLYGYGLVCVGAAALVCRAFGRTPLWWTIGIVGASVPAAVTARVIVEVAMDPTDHNLWPFELVIAGWMGVAASGVGSLLGNLPALATRMGRSERQ